MFKKNHIADMILVMAQCNDKIPGKGPPNAQGELSFQPSQYYHFNVLA